MYVNVFYLSRRNKFNRLLRVFLKLTKSEDQAKFYFFIVKYDIFNHLGCEFNTYTPIFIKCSLILIYIYI